MGGGGNHLFHNLVLFNWVVTKLWVAFCRFLIKAQNFLKVELVEVADYISTNQDPPIPKMTFKGDFLYFEKMSR